MSSDAEPYPWEPQKPVDLTPKKSMQINNKAPDEWRCKHGHTWSHPGSILNAYLKLADGRERNTGPLCPFCLFDHLERNFSATMVRKGKSKE